MKHGYVKVAAAIPFLKVADCSYNIRQIEQLMKKALSYGVQLMVFPELSVTGYSCMDLFAQDHLLRSAEQALMELIRRTKGLDILAVVGMPLYTENRLLNTAVVFHRGKILGVVPKTYLPNYKEFQEKRWFSSGSELTETMITIGEASYPLSSQLLFRSEELVLGVEICEDLWTPIPTSTIATLNGANVIFNLSASNELTGKNSYLRDLIAQQSARCITGYVYASAGFGESTTDLVYAGKGFIMENGVVLKESQRFPMQEKLVISEIDLSYLRHDRQVRSSFKDVANLYADHRAPVTITCDLSKGKDQLTRLIDPHPFVPSDDHTRDERCEEILHIQTNGLAKRLTHTQMQHAVIGVSGGLDSTLALLVTVMAFDALGLPRKQILGVTMPGFGTTTRTYKNAVALINILGLTLHDISIEPACLQHFKDIGHDGKTEDVTFENAQARERTQILMDLANKVSGLVIGTGDLSELALGWATYNGDHMSMYAVNVSVPKTLVRTLVTWAAEHRMDEIVGKILLDIVETPISPELTNKKENGENLQKTEELIGPYELHDFFLYHFMRYGATPTKIFFLAQEAFKERYSTSEIKKWLQLFLHRFFSQQFKRSCLPDGPKVGSISLSPRCDWRMPSDASAAIWLKEAASL